MMMKKTFIATTLLLACTVVSAQVSSPTSAASPSTPAATSSAPMPGGILGSFGQLDQTARQTVMDLGRVRVEKWKTDGNTKQQSRSNVDSLQKNLNAALPALMQQVQENPANVAPALKLYRNLNVVYDVLASVTESAGAFGSKDDYQALATDTANVDQVRRNIADQLEQMAAAKDAAYVQLTSQLKAQQAEAAAAAPPKKVIVDDNEPPKKPAKKKKAAPAAQKAQEPPKTQ